MTQEEKILLLKDLCARIPYGIKAEYENNIVNIPKIEEDGTVFYFRDSQHLGYLAISYIKPYLRSMSSMTEKERIEFSNLFYKWHDDELFDYIEEGVEFSIWKYKGISPVIFDWLNAHHFDYRGLIEKGLALEAPSNMYNN